MEIKKMAQQKMTQQEYEALVEQIQNEQKINAFFGSRTTDIFGLAEDHFGPYAASSKEEAYKKIANGDYSYDNVYFYALAYLETDFDDGVNEMYADEIARLVQWDVQNFK